MCKPVRRFQRFCLTAKFHENCLPTKTSKPNIWTVEELISPSHYFTLLRVSLCMCICVSICTTPHPCASYQAPYIRHDNISSQIYHKANACCYYKCPKELKHRAFTMAFVLAAKVIVIRCVYALLRFLGRCWYIIHVYRAVGLCYIALFAYPTRQCDVAWHVVCTALYTTIFFIVICITCAAILYIRTSIYCYAVDTFFSM